MSDLLSTGELQALAVTAELANMLLCVVGHGPTRTDDLAELWQHVHAIQHAVMSQAAARAYPERFRLLGVVAGATVYPTDADGDPVPVMPSPTEATL